MFTDDESSDEEVHDNFSVENESSYHRTIINNINVFCKTFYMHKAIFFHIYVPWYFFAC